MPAGPSREARTTPPPRRDGQPPGPTPPVASAPPDSEEVGAEGLGARLSGAGAEGAGSGSGAPERSPPPSPRPVASGALGVELCPPPPLEPPPDPPLRLLPPPVEEPEPSPAAGPAFGQRDRFFFAFTGRALGRLAFLAFERGLGGAFGAVAVDPERGGHEVVPDQGREGAAEHGAAVEGGRHRDQLVGVADPHGDGVLRVPADEPGVAVVRGRAGLAGGELADRGGLAGAVLQHGLQHRGLGLGDARRQHALVRTWFTSWWLPSGSRGSRRRLPGSPRGRRRSRPACRLPAARRGRSSRTRGPCPAGSPPREPAYRHRGVGRERRRMPIRWARRAILLVPTLIPTSA